MVVIIKDGRYKIENVGAKGRVLDKKPNNKFAFATEGSQDMWQITSLDGGDYCNIAFIGPDTIASRIDLYHQDKKAGTKIIISEENETPAQRWQITETEKGSKKYRILYGSDIKFAIAVESTEGKSIGLELVDAKPADANQQWVFEFYE